MEISKVGVKFFIEEQEPLGLVEFIPMLHRWIQNRALPDLLIDVADYSHVYQGPGIVLLTYEGNYGIDEHRGRRGVVYYRKRPFRGGLADCLASVSKLALLAAQCLEQELGLAGRLRVRANEIQVFANDRLAAPNSDQTFETFSPALEQLLGKLYPGEGYTLAGDPDPKERFSVTADVTGPQSTTSLLGRLAS
ncbi:MAG: hypothetical protein ACREVH_09325 [Gammaproteobacteria bacterium]